MQQRSKEPVEWNLPGQRPDSRAIAQIVAIGEPAVAVVVNDLALSPQEFLRSIGIELLTGIGDPAVPALLKLARTGDQQQPRGSGAEGGAPSLACRYQRAGVWR